MHSAVKRKTPKNGEIPIITSNEQSRFISTDEEFNYTSLTQKRRKKQSYDKITEEDFSKSIQDLEKTVKIKEKNMRMQTEKRNK